jgi:hypothetical protein
MLRPMSPSRSAAAAVEDAWRDPWSARYRSTVDSGSARPKVTVLTPMLHSTYNSNIPYSVNDGAMWAGRGTSIDLTAGARVSWRGLSLQVAPEYARSENQSIALAPLTNRISPFAQPYADRVASERIDFPQRFGAGTYARLTPGQTSLAYAGKGVTAGVSTENMWWGPGIDNSLLMTNTAGGFTHWYVGTQRPADVKIGRLEALYTIGFLKTSPFWRTPADTFPEGRWLNSLAVVFEPKATPGMYFGAARVFYAYQRDYPITVREILNLFQTFKKSAISVPGAAHNDDIRDQMLSLWFRWAFPREGFEAYGELGRNDHSWDARDFNLQPDHSGAYLLGARKVVRAGPGILSLRAEALNLSSTQTYFMRATPSWYMHYLVQQGYTNVGQVIGAGIGPGGHQQTFAADWFVPRGRAGLVIERRVPNFDEFLRAPVDTVYASRYNYQEVELAYGPRVTTWFRGVQLDISYSRRRTYNRFYVYRNDVRNEHFELRAQYLLP